MGPLARTHGVTSNAACMVHTNAIGNLGSMIIGSVVPMELMQPIMPGISVAASSVMQITADLATKCTSRQFGTVAAAVDAGVDTTQSRESEGGGCQEQVTADASVFAPGTLHNSLDGLPSSSSEDEPGSPSPFRCVTDFQHVAPIPNKPQGHDEVMPQPSNHYNSGHTQYVYVPVPVSVPVVQLQPRAQDFQSCVEADADS